MAQDRLLPWGHADVLSRTGASPITEPIIHRLSAFTQDPDGGNPAGVVLLDTAPDRDWMQSTARAVGYSETAFLWPAEGGWETRYHSPEAEVAFCGHATVAAGVLLGELEGPGPRELFTTIGQVHIEVVVDAAGGVTTLTSVVPSVREVPPALLAQVLDTFGWGAHHLVHDQPPVVAYAGSHHLLLPVRSRTVLESMAYDFPRLRTLMVANELTTVAAMWRKDAATWHARNAFPVGGVIEDPATGSAAAAFGGWLRVTQQVAPPADVVVHQGADIGRPSRLEVHIPVSGGIQVRGRAVHIPAHAG